MNSSNPHRRFDGARACAAEPSGGREQTNRPLCPLLTNYTKTLRTGKFFDSSKYALFGSAEDWPHSTEAMLLDRMENEAAMRRAERAQPGDSERRT
jgi:hypothetical protein